MKKTFKGEKIEKNETEMAAALDKLDIEFREALKKKDKRAMDGETVVTTISYLANEGLFTEEMVMKHYVLFKGVELLNFRHKFVMPYIMGEYDNFEILTHNAEVFNKCGIKAERT